MKVDKTIEQILLSQGKIESLIASLSERVNGVVEIMKINQQNTEEFIKCAHGQRDIINGELRKVNETLGRHDVEISSVLKSFESHLVTHKENSGETRNWIQFSIQVLLPIFLSVGALLIVVSHDYIHVI